MIRREARPPGLAFPHHRDAHRMNLDRRLAPAVALWLALAGAAAGAEAPPPLKVCLVSGSEEYRSDASLEGFQKFLEANYPARCTLLKARGFDDLPGLEALEDCDVALFFTRRLTIGGDQLARVRKYAESGRPLVALRTASHGFQNYLEFDKDVLGGHYQNHRSNDLTTRVTLAPEAAKHPVLEGVKGMASLGSLYKNTPLAADARPLLVGTTPEGVEPVAWVREHKGGRVFSTSIGAPGDFENASYRRLVANGLFWAAKRDIPKAKSELATPPARPKPEGTLRLKLRTRVEPFKGAGEFAEADFSEEFSVAETAIVICDVWDRHWCAGSSVRCDAIARKMAPVVAAARAKGVQILHAPSDCMDFYAGTPQRLRVQLAPKVTAPPLLPIDCPALPIDDSEGGCDTGESTYLAWTRQHPAIDIGEFDGVSDDGDEVYGFFKQQGIKNVIVMGVHTNMCVLNRGFAIKRMTRLGMRCVLVRDLTDTMYDPKARPVRAPRRGDRFGRQVHRAVLGPDHAERRPGGRPAEMMGTRRSATRQTPEASR